MNIALAHDSFTQLGGAERIATALHELYPESPVYTLVVDSKLRDRMPGWDIHPTWLQSIYDIYPRFQHLFPLIPMVLATTKAIAADILISSSSSYAKGFNTNKNTVHINYCHTPTRFLWVDPQHAYNEIFPLLRPLARIYFWFLKQWDLHAAAKVDYFIANSKEVQGRINRAYGRESVIIYPFVDTSFYQPTAEKQGYFLVGGRLQRAKNLDLVIKVFNELKMPLHVVGTGRYESQLRALAGPTIKFVGQLDDNGLRDEYSGAQALIYPQLEDFGMMPLEAAACGTATIGLAAGGSMETIIPGVTGELLPQITDQSLIETIKRWDSNKYQKDALRQHAAQFSKEIFKTKLGAFVENIKP